MLWLNRRKYCGIFMNTRLGGPHSRSGRTGYEKRRSYQESNFSLLLSSQPLLLHARLGGESEQTVTAASKWAHYTSPWRKVEVEVFGMFTGKLRTETLGEDWVPLLLIRHKSCKDRPGIEAPNPFSFQHVSRTPIRFAMIKQPSKQTQNGSNQPANKPTNIITKDSKS